MIVNTRPLDLSQKTNSLLARSQQSFIHIPLTRILKTEPSLQALKYIKNLQNYDVLIFTSQSAVIHGAKFFKEALVANKKIPRIESLTDSDIDTFPCYASLNETIIDISKIRDKDKLIILIYTHQSLKVLIKELPMNKNQQVIFIVASKRIAELTKEYGFRNVILAESPHDKDMVEAALAEA